MTKIVRLTAKNVKRLSAVQIEPDGSLVIIGGDNEQGKTSVLDSITYALAGGRAICERPLREGEEKGYSELELDCGLVVRRTFTKGGGGTLTVANAEGARYPSPQAILDQMIGALTFDPLAFSRMEPHRQLEALRDLVGLDFSDLDRQRADVYGERTEVNRDAKRLEAEWRGAMFYEDAPEEEVDPAALLSEIEAFAEKRTAADRQEHELGNFAQHTATLLQAQADTVERIRELRIEIAKLGALMVERGREIDSRHKNHSSMQRALNEFVGGIPPVEPLRKSLRAAEDVNRQVRANRDHEQKLRCLKDAKNRSSLLTDRLDEIDAQKASVLKEAKFPVDGLGFGEHGVLMNGLPFDQASGSETLRVSTAMGIAMNPDLRVLLLRDGSLLDAHSMDTLAEMAEQSECQIWLERVGDGDESAIVIEDGHVREV